MTALDRHACLWINGWPEWLSPFLTFFSVAMEYWFVKAFFGVVLLAMILRSPRSRAAALLAILALAMANGLTDILKHTMPTPRPFQVADFGSLIHMRVGTSPSPGTASAHAANMAALATVTTLLLGRWGWPWIAVALITGISRVYVGAHFPSQVLLGFACGGLSAGLWVSVYRSVTARRDSRIQTLK